jgi:hypothetical protein
LTPFVIRCIAEAPKWKGQIMTNKTSDQTPYRNESDRSFGQLCGVFSLVKVIYE